MTDACTFLPGGNSGFKPIPLPSTETREATVVLIELNGPFLEGVPRVEWKPKIISAFPDWLLATGGEAPGAGDQCAFVVYLAFEPTGRRVVGVYISHEPPSWEEALVAIKASCSESSDLNIEWPQFQ